MILAESPNKFAGQSDTLTERVIGEAMPVHRVLGNGFLESVYRNALVLRLQKAGIGALVEHPLSVRFEGAIVGESFADILVEDRLILELKSVSALATAHEVQLVNYLAATCIEVGLLSILAPRAWRLNAKTGS